MKRMLLITLSALLLTFTACDHKELSLYSRPSMSLRIVYDWQLAPEANPASMVTWLFPTNAEDGEPMRFVFVGRDGGTIRIAPGGYHAVSLNNDLIDWARFRNTDDIETFELYTEDTGVLQALGISARSIPRAPGSETERMAKTPEMVWNHQTRDLSFDEKNGPFTMTFTPDEAVCHYTVTVLDVTHIENVSGSRLDATLSGMAEGFLHGSHTATSTPVTMTFTLSPQSKNRDTTNTLYAEFLTFGEATGTNVPHLLTVYMVLTDGSAKYFTYDVTDQVRNATDPRHVDIVVRGLDIPAPVVNEAGFQPSVEDWISESQTLKM